MIGIAPLSCVISEGHSRVVEYVRYSYDNSKFVSFSGSAVFIWKKDGTFLRDMQFADYVSSISSNDDLTELIVALNNGQIVVYDVENSLITNSFYSNSDKISQVVLHNNTIVASSWDGKIRKWDRNGVLIDVYDTEDPIYCLSVCDKYYVIGNENGNVKIFNPIKKRIKTLYSHNDEVNDVFISKSCNHFVSGSIDGRIILYCINDEKKVIIECGAGVTSVVISEDEKTIVSGSWDDTIKIWDISGKLIKSFNAHSEAVTTVDLSSDGKNIISGSYDKDIKIWSIRGELIRTIGLSKIIKYFNRKMWNID